jgi:hypothetical protein
MSLQPEKPRSAPSPWHRLRWAVILIGLMCPGSPPTGRVGTNWWNAGASNGAWNQPYDVRFAMRRGFACLTRQRRLQWQTVMALKGC